jgi:Glycosyltransferase family 87
VRERLAEALHSDPLRLFAFILAFFALTQAWYEVERMACIDYYQFWVVGQAVRAREAGDVYSAEERARLGRLYYERAVEEAGPSPETSRRWLAARRRETLETYSTPWLYTLFAAFSTGDYARDETRFQRVSLAAYVAGIALFCSALGYSVAAAAAALAVFLWWFAPAVSDMHVGNVNRLEIALLAAFAAGRSMAARAVPERIATLATGALLGAAVLFKPNLVFVPIVVGSGWLALGRRRETAWGAAGFAIGAAASLALSVIAFGSAGAWRSWWAELPELLREYDHTLESGNYALIRLLKERAGIDASVALPVVLLAALAAALFIAGRARRGAPAEALRRSDALWDALLTSLGAAVSLLAAQLAWAHYFLLAIPLALVLLRPAAVASRWIVVRRAGAILGVTLVAMESWRSILGVGENSPAAEAAIVSSGALILFALGLRECVWLARERPA